VLTLLSAASFFSLMYRFFAVEGHTEADPPSPAIWASLVIEVIAAIAGCVAFAVLLRAGLLRWWPERSLIQRWRERRRQKAGQ